MRELAMCSVILMEASLSLDRVDRFVNGLRAAADRIWQADLEGSL